MGLPIVESLDVAEAEDAQLSTVEVPEVAEAHRCHRLCLGRCLHPDDATLKTVEVQEVADADDAELGTVEA